MEHQVKLRQTYDILQNTMLNVGAAEEEEPVDVFKRRLPGRTQSIESVRSLRSPCDNNLNFEHDLLLARDSGEECQEH